MKGISDWSVCLWTKMLEMNHGVGRTIIFWQSLRNALCHPCSLHVNTSYSVLASLCIFHTHHTFILLTIDLYGKCHDIALCPFYSDKLHQVPPFYILYLWMWVAVYSIETFCLQKAGFYSPGFNYTLNPQILKRHDLIACVSNCKQIRILFLAQQAKCRISQLFSTQLQKS